MVVQNGCPYSSDYFKFRLQYGNFSSNNQNFGTISIKKSKGWIFDGRFFNIFSMADFPTPPQCSDGGLVAVLLAPGRHAGVVAEGAAGLGGIAPVRDLLRLLPAHPGKGS